jgi:hypothetical protein
MTRTSVDAQDEELRPWIATVRHRLARDQFADLDPVRVLDDCAPLPGELFVRVMVADYDHYHDFPPACLQEPDLMAKWLGLLEDLRRLRELIG